MTGAELERYLAECRHLTLGEIERLIPTLPRSRSALYDLMREYPLRESKALRPALCIASCRALGGSLESVARSAAILELYHNAFLIHDDVEDGSETRRDRPTLHAAHGVPIAVNVGDAMLALALEPLLDNMRVLGLGKALRIMQVIARMARETTEGQAIELEWIRSGAWGLADSDYLRMVYKKTSWYTFVTPMIIGGIVAGAPPTYLTTLRRFAALLGIAFQIQDDILNLTAEGAAYGKEHAGDLWEGKHTLLLMHALRAATVAERGRAHRILSKRRPSCAAAAHAGRLTELLSDLERRAEMSPAARIAIAAALRSGTSGNGTDTKTDDDVRFLMTLIEGYDSVRHTRAVAQRFARAAEHALARAPWLVPSVHREFLEALVDFVITRDR